MVAQPAPQLCKGGQVGCKSNGFALVFVDIVNDPIIQTGGMQQAGSLSRNHVFAAQGERGNAHPQGFTGRRASGKWKGIEYHVDPSVSAHIGSEAAGGMNAETLNGQAIVRATLDELVLCECCVELSVLKI